MTNLDGSLKLFAYHGRENGLMVVGSREAMQELSNQLQNALANGAPPSKNGWPPVLVSSTVKMGPYKESWDYELSFHIEGSSPAEATVPMRRRNLPILFSLSILVLAIAGVFSIVRWAAHGL